jgi:hypothetical protein
MARASRKSDRTFWMDRARSRTWEPEGVQFANLKWSESCRRVLGGVPVCGRLRQLQFSQTFPRFRFDDSSHAG